MSSHGVAAIAEPSAFAAATFEAAAELVDDERGKRFAVDVLGGDEERLAGLHHSLEERHSIAGFAMLPVRLSYLASTVRPVLARKFRTVGPHRPRWWRCRGSPVRRNHTVPAPKVAETFPTFPTSPGPRAWQRKGESGNRAVLAADGRNIPPFPHIPRMTRRWGSRRGMCGRFWAKPAGGKSFFRSGHVSRLPGARRSGYLDPVGVLGMSLLTAQRGQSLQRLTKNRSETSRSTHTHV